MNTKSVKTELDEHIYRILAASVLVLLVVGTVSYRLLEDWSWVDSLYFSVVAASTVGFGDLTPTSDAAKLFTIVYIFVGVGIITTYINARVRHVGRRRQQRS